VKAIPGTLREGGAAFATTHWSVISACPRGSEIETEAAKTALAQLCGDYWPPLYSFARRRGYHSVDAQDLVQGFFAYFLRSQAYGRTDPHKGKFRSFLIASFKHYIADVWDRDRALKRGGNHEFILLEEQLAAVEALYANNSVTLNEDRHYEQNWATAVVARALNLLSGEFLVESRARLFKELRPFLSGGLNIPTQEQVAQRLDMPIETLRSHVSRLRVRYRALLRAEVARTIGLGEDVDEELRHLREILTAAS
jgi:RNA polymerase sigma factor (sigma-70 family)